jgi:hypothetical protein
MLKIIPWMEIRCYNVDLFLMFSLLTSLGDKLKKALKVVQYEDDEKTQGKQRFALSISSRKQTKLASGSITLKY